MWELVIARKVMSITILDHCIVRVYQTLKSLKRWLMSWTMLLCLTQNEESMTNSSDLKFNTLTVALSVCGYLSLAVCMHVCLYIWNKLLTVGLLVIHRLRLTGHSVLSHPLSASLCFFYCKHSLLYVQLVFPIFYFYIFIESYWIPVLMTFPCKLHNTYLILIILLWT